MGTNSRNAIPGQLLHCMIEEALIFMRGILKTQGMVLKKPDCDQRVPLDTGTETKRLASGDPVTEEPIILCTSIENPSHREKNQTSRHMDQIFPILKGKWANPGKSVRKALNSKIWRARLEIWRLTKTGQGIGGLLINRLWKEDARKIWKNLPRNLFWENQQSC